jgi:hypothetical protein
VLRTITCLWQEFDMLQALLVCLPYRSCSAVLDGENVFFAVHHRLFTVQEMYRFKFRKF